MEVILNLAVYIYLGISRGFCKGPSLANRNVLTDSLRHDIRFHIIGEIGVVETMLQGPRNLEAELVEVLVGKQTVTPAKLPHLLDATGNLPRIYLKADTVPNSIHNIVVRGLCGSRHTGEIVEHLYKKVTYLRNGGDIAAGGSGVLRRFPKQLRKFIQVFNHLAPGHVSVTGVTPKAVSIIKIEGRDKCIWVTQGQHSQTGLHDPGENNPSRRNRTRRNRARRNWTGRHRTRRHRTRRNWTRHRTHNGRGSVSDTTSTTGRGLRRRSYHWRSSPKSSASSKRRRKSSRRVKIPTRNGGGSTRTRSEKSGRQIEGWNQSGTGSHFCWCQSRPIRRISDTSHNRTSNNDGRPGAGTIYSGVEVKERGDGRNRNSMCNPGHDRSMKSRISG